MSIADDAGGCRGLFKVPVFSIQDDLAVKEVEHVDFEFGGEGDGKPDAVGLRGVGTRA
jgi:hypothetical protein